MYHWPFHFNLGFNLQLDCAVMDIVNTIVTILAFIFAVIQFVKQNEENRKTTIEQNKKNWYLSVLVIPYLEHTNAFFEELVESLKNLKTTQNNTNLILLAKEQMSYKEKIEAFIAPLEASIASYDKTIRQDISNLGLALQDEVTKLLSDANIHPSELERRIMEHKGNLIGVLYRPINGVKKNNK